MGVVARPPVVQPEHDEREALIREARARRRKRRLGAAALVAMLAGAALGISSTVGGTSSGSTVHRGPGSVAASTRRCGVRGEGVRIFQNGRIVYREPGRYVDPHGGPPPTIQCSGVTIWAVFFNGAGMSQEAYVGVRSIDRGRTWKLVFAEGEFGVKAPHRLDAYLGVWRLHGPRDAYFTGTCPACGFGTTSLWVTKDAGRTFRAYEVPALDGYGPTSIRVSRHQVTIRAERVARKIGSPPYEIYRHKTVRLRVA
jgi:hypothetical protein